MFLGQGLMEFARRVAPGPALRRFRLPLSGAPRSPAWLRLTLTFRLVFGRRGWLDTFRFLAGGGSFELADGPAHCSAYLRQSAHAEDDDNYHQDEDQFHSSKLRHCSLLVLNLNFDLNLYFGIFFSAS